jgi:hypothetical protein
MHKITKIQLTLLAIVALGLAFVGYQAWVRYTERPYEELRAAMHNLQRDIERYAVDTEGSYPPNLARFVAQRHIELPDNPFGPGKMKILKQGEPWQPGGIVYAAWGPLVWTAKNSKGEEKVYQSRTDSPNLPPEMLIPTDYDEFILIAYSPRQHKRRSKAMAIVKTEYEKAMRKFESGDLEVQIPVYADGVDWNHVEVVLIDCQNYID